MKLWKWELDCGRMGTLGGAFFATDEQLERVLGCEVYLDDVLGKHSEICFTLERDLFTELQLSAESTKTLIDKLGTVLMGEDLILHVEESGQLDDEDDD